MYVVTGNICLVLSANYYYIHFQYGIVEWNIILQKSKSTLNPLPMSINSVRIMAGYAYIFTTKRL